MPITKSAKKALKQTRQRRVFNLRRLRKMRSAVKEFRGLIGKNSISEAEKKLPEAYKALDKAAKRGVIKTNTASRKKSRLAKALKRARGSLSKASAA